MAEKDKRRAARHTHNSVVEIYDESGNMIAELGRLVDFSNVGACFSTPRIFPMHKKLRLRLRLLKEGRLYIWARIVWTKKKSNTILYGIEFEKVHEVA
jgi:hypothetical protein